MSTLPTDSELLLPFEQEKIKGDYRDYYKAKRNNFLATVEKFVGLWKAFLDLDSIFIYEIKAMNALGDVNQLMPAMLLLTAHSQVRNSIELGFASCPNDGISLMRNAIESTVFALKMFREPSTALIWASKDDGPTELEAFKDHFERKKKENLFPAGFGLEVLHQYWSDLSEAGSHTTPGSVGYRFEKVAIESGEEWRINYTGVDEQKLVMSAVTLINVASLIERATYGVFEKRLQFDLSLVERRERFHKQWGAAARTILTKMGLAPIVQP